jgi:hypothetical protein
LPSDGIGSALEQNMAQTTRQSESGIKVLIAITDQDGAVDRMQLAMVALRAYRLGH